MNAVVIALLLCSWCLDMNVGVTHWELQTLNLPPSHIPYFMRRKSSDEEFCKDGNCQVYRQIYWSYTVIVVKYC